MKWIIVSLAMVAAVCACGPKKYKSEVKAVYAPAPAEKIEIVETVGYDTVTQFIATLAQEKNLDTGKRAIIAFLQQHYPGFNTAFLDNIDMHALRTELLERIEAPLTDSPPDSGIHALFFGLFISDRPQFSPTKRPITILYITGSRRTPTADKQGWTNDPAYFPEEKYYITPEAFVAMNRALDGYTHTERIEEIIFSGMLNLILGNSAKEIKEYSGLKNFYVGAGFDEATIFEVGKIY